jgi:tRNA A37 methylthiotransferase MiaB
MQGQAPRRPDAGGSPGTFAVVEASCHRRLEDIAAVRRFFVANGWREALRIDVADVVVYIACGGFRINVDEALLLIGATRARMKNGATLIVGGCLPHTDAEALRTIFTGPTLTYTDATALDNLPGVVTPFGTLPPPYGESAVCDRSLAPPPRPGGGLRGWAGSTLRRVAMRVWPTPAGRHAAFALRERERVVISIGAGCSRACTYCAKRFARGSVRSKPIDVVVRQIADAAALGYRRFDLYADSIGEYGRDLGTDLTALLERVAAATGPRVSVGLYDLHPEDFIRHFGSILALSRAGQLHYLYVVTESGSERVLSSMGRLVDTSELVRRLLEVRGNQRLFMQSAIIVGYPGETDDEFEETVALLERVGFDHVHVHCYCDMPNTESSRLGGKTPREVMARRLRRMGATGIRHTPAEALRELDHA